MFRYMYSAFVSYRLGQGKTISELEKAILRRIGVRIKTPIKFQHWSGPVHEDNPSYTLKPAMYRPGPSSSTKVLTVPLEWTKDEGGPPARKVLTQGDTIDHGDLLAHFGFASVG